VHRALQGFKTGAVLIETLLETFGALKRGRFLSRHFWDPPGLQKRVGSYRDNFGDLQGSQKGEVPIETLLRPSKASKKGRFLVRHFLGTFRALKKGRPLSRHFRGPSGL